MPHSEFRMVILVADFLDEAGFKVFEAVNADEAIAMLQAWPDVQAVVTDIEMPGSMNGLGLARVVRERWPGVGVVVTSGRSQPGPDNVTDQVAFLRKPYLPKTVTQAIRKMAGPQVADAMTPADE